VRIILPPGIRTHGEYSRFSSWGIATVETPVARRPPCSPGRAVFPHPVPRLHSRPRRVIPCLLSPAGRWAHAVPVRHVRDECPFRAACFRRVLPPVVGFPHRRVRRSIRLPNCIWRAFPLPVLLRLPVGRFASTVPFQPRAGAGFPLVYPHSCIPPLEPSRAQERLGPPTFLHVSLPATA
jgi:hypothetical protein